MKKSKTSKTKAKTRSRATRPKAQSSTLKVGQLTGCSLTPSGLNYKAKSGSSVTVKIVADNTKIVRAEYDGQEIPVTDNESTAFTVTTGRKLLILNLAGPQEDVAIVEDCGSDPAQTIGGYSNDAQPALGFTIIGT